jgi:hypothetical protein
VAPATSPSGVFADGPADQNSGVIEPLHFLSAIVPGVFLIILSRGSVRDLDVWWHRAIGEEIWQRRTVFGLGNAWAPFGDQNWFTTQWLSEIGVYWAHAVGGWQAIPVVRVLASACLMLALAWAVLPGRPARAAVSVYVLALLALLPALSQDRVQTVALLLCVPLGVWLARGVSGRYPRWWQVALLAIAWANLHGSWVLLPVGLGLLTVAVLIDAEQRPRWHQPLALTGIALVAGMVNPATWQSLASVWRFNERTSHLLEWQPTIPSEIGALPFFVLVVLLPLTWARRRAVPWAEVVVALGVVGFSLIAFRNVLFATIMLAPLVAESLAPFTRRRVAMPAEARAIVWASALSAASCLAVAVTFALTTNPLADARPLKIAEYLAAVDGPKRIYNNYNTAGVLLAFGGPRIELGIDGRADRYPADYTARYMAAEAQLQDWQAVLTDVQPDFAVLHVDNALPTFLQEQGWRLLLQDGDYVLLEPTRP